MTRFALALVLALLTLVPTNAFSTSAVLAPVPPPPVACSDVLPYSVAPATGTAFAFNFGPFPGEVDSWTASVVHNTMGRQVATDGRDFVSLGSHYSLFIPLSPGGMGNEVNEWTAKVQVKYRGGGKCEYLIPFSRPGGFSFSVQPGLLSLTKSLDLNNGPTSFEGTVVLKNTSTMTVSMVTQNLTLVGFLPGKIVVTLTLIPFPRLCRAEPGDVCLVKYRGDWREGGTFPSEGASFSGAILSQTYLADYGVPLGTPSFTGATFTVPVPRK